MITLHESNITSFPHDNGIGVLKDVIRAYAEEELNGMFEFYMEYDSEGHLVDELKEERIIKAKAQDKLGYQLFRIYSITKNHENDNLIVRAQHITYDLADNFVEKLEANNLTKKQVMELIGSSTVLPHPFNITSPNTTTRSSTKLYRTNPLQMIGGMEGSVLQIWGGQIERDNFNLILHDRRGSDDGVKVTYEKNITGLEATFDISNLVTRIFPFVFIEGSDNEPSRLITVNGKYIDSPLINNYEKIYIKPIDYSHDERIDTQDKTDAQIRQQLEQVASRYFEETGNDKIKVEMEVSFEHLWETEEYKDLAVLELVGLGDTVTIEHSRLKVNATAIVNYIRYDCIAEKNEEVRLGSVKARLTDSVNKVVDVAEKAEQAQQTANQAIRTANGKNTIYYGPDEPEGGIKGDLWFRVVDGEYTRTYRHDGIQWQLVLSVDVRDAIDEAQQAKDDAQQAVDRANQATQQATNAINQAQTAFDEAQAALSTASNAYDIATTLQGDVTNLSTLVDEHTGQISSITQSVSSLTTRVGDAEGNITALQQTANSLAGRLSDAEGNITTLTATVQGLQTRVSDAEGNISSVTQLANALQVRMTDAEGDISTLTQTASSLQSTVSSLQAELDGLEIGGRNLIRNSDFSDGNKYWSGNFTRVVKDGKNAIEMIGNNGNNLVGIGENEYFLLEPNTIYTYQVEIMVDTQIVVSKYQPLHYHIRADGDNQGGREWIVLKSPSVLTPNKWHKIILQFKTKDITSPITFRPFIYEMPAGVKFWITYFKLEKGNKATDWTPAPEDMATQSQITQLSDAINLRVMKGDVINQINISDESILIDGKRIHITGQTTIDDASIDGAKIKDASIGTAQIGTIDAYKINANNLESLSSKTGELEITGWLTISSTNYGIQSTYNYGDTYGQAYNARWFDGDYQLGYRYHKMTANVYEVTPSNTRGTFLYYTETFLGADMLKFREYNNRTQALNNGIPRYHLDIQANRIVMGKNWDTGIVLDAENHSLYSEGASQFGERTRVLGETTGLLVGRINAPVEFNTLQFNNDRAGLAQLVLGRDADGKYMRVDSVRSRTYDLPANVYVSPNGTIGFAASSKKYKSDIKLAENDNEIIEKLKQLDAKTWVRKDLYEKGVLERSYGLIAEDLHELGLVEFVSYDDDGEVVGIHEPRLVVPLIMWNKLLDKKLTDVTDDVEWLKLENQYLKQKIEQLEEMIA